MLILSLRSEAAWYKLLSGVCKPVTVSDNRIILSSDNKINNVTEKKRAIGFSMVSIIDKL